MPDPLIVTPLREKQAEIERHIEASNVQLDPARASLLPVMVTIRSFDPDRHEDGPATEYHGAHRAM